VRRAYIIVVDREQRLLTLAIDVYSRMVVGFCISLDPPGAISTGLCIAHAVLPKEAWLENRLQRQQARAPV